MRSLLPASLLATALVFGLVTEARAADEGPCGNFDFSAGVSCKIEIEGGCTAQCDAPKVVVACSGKCTATADQTCTDTCGESCIKQCNPALLDCFKGCHDECDQPTIKICQEKKPGEDCVTQAKAQCDQHCKNNCKVPDNNCQEHCDKCCVGSCQTQVNFDCDFGCMADVEVNCKASCTKPAGGIFCNGQYVNATDVEACIKHLATKNLNVDVSARASGGCTSGNCSGQGSVSISKPNVPGSGGGCASTPGSSNGVSAVLALLGVVLGASLIKRRRDER